MLGYQKLQKLPAWAKPEIEGIEWTIQEIPERGRKFYNSNSESNKLSVKTVRKLKEGSSKNNISAFTSNEETDLMNSKSMKQSLKVVLAYQQMPVYLLKNYTNMIE